MPIVTQSPSRVPPIQSRTWPMAAFAALAAEDSPRASMIAAPRFWMAGMKVCSSQLWSLIIGQTFLPSASAWKMSGYWVAEWFPQTVTFRIALTGFATLCAVCDTALLWSRRIMPANCAGFRPGAFFIAMRQLVFAGLPTTRTFTSRLATLSSARPCGAKILPFAEQVLALHAGTARPRADQQRDVDIAERDLRLGGGRHALEQGKGAVVELHHHALQRLLRLLVRDLEHLQDHRLVPPQHLARGDAKQQRVADLAGGAGHGDAYGDFGHVCSGGGLRSDGTAATQAELLHCSVIITRLQWRMRR